MIELTNSHCHTGNSDGCLSVLETAQFGIQKGLKHLYITDHHIPRNTKFDFSLVFPDYFEEIESAKAQLSGQIGLYKGVELDWIQGYETWFEEQAKREFDFVLGSIHTVTKEFVYGMEFPIKTHKIYVKEYFKQMRRLATSGLADSIAHLDLVKFCANESEPYYREEVERTLEAIAKSKTAIEINTSGKRKSLAEFHPSSWILKKAFKLGIPLTLGADTHNARDHIDYELVEAYALARTTGYRSILRFENRKPIEMAI